MDDTTIAITIISANAVITSVIMGIFSLTINNRITDLRDSLNRRIDDQNLRFDDLMKHIDRRFDDLIRVLEQRKSA